VPTIDELKELEITPTPLFLFECTLRNGTVERWGTHGVTFGGHEYGARLLRHNLFELRSSADEGLDGAAKISVSLANADSHFSQVERETGFKGARVTIQFLFFDLVEGEAASEARVVFQGIAGDAEEITEEALRVTFANRFNLQRIVLPEVRMQRRCPWLFPATEEQRQEALDGGAKGKYSALHRCGYSAGLAGGEGSLDGGVPFTTCDYTRASCEARGMFSLGRFGGLGFLPTQIQVRSHGESGTHLSPVVENQARYNDFVPLVYGTAWYEPPVVFARNDGNLTGMEVLLGAGEIDDVVRLVVNDVEIPEAVNGTDMSATGWYRIVTPGTRNGIRNEDFSDGSGSPLGDPYGSMAMASVVVPNSISNGQSLPKVKVLLRGMKLPQFDGEGVALGESFTKNPAWVLLDVLRRSGWMLDEIDLPSFAEAAVYCEETIFITDLYGNETSTRRYQCNLVVRGRKSAADLVRGIRASSALLLTYGAGGKLSLRVENTIALQQPEKPGGSNSAEALNGGWPAYEFSDGSADFSGILRRANGEPSLRVFSRPASDVPNRFTVEFQDEFNEFQQDSSSLVDVDDALLTGQEVTASHPALGLANFDQATRALSLSLAKAIEGNTFVEFETSVRGVGLAPGDLITVTYLKEGLDRQLFRVVRLAPGVNASTVRITAQWHEDVWYPAGGADAAGGRRRSGAQVGMPRPLVGAELDEHGMPQFAVSDVVQALPNAEAYVRIKAGFSAPAKPTPAGVNVPLVNLTPEIESTGGTLAGEQTLYYAVSAKDADGSESGLSFAIRAKIPSGGDTNTVTLEGLSFSDGTVGFNVYRGSAPSQLLRIAEDEAVAASFIDAGLEAELVGPPDENFHHANFYWRTEMVPENNAETFSLTSIGNGSLSLGSDDFKGAVVRITRGTGATQERTVVSNTATTFTVSSPWRVEPDATSYFTVADATWRFGGQVTTSPAEFEGPPLPGTTVQISGRAANVLNRESAYELSPVTRWQIGSAGGVDTDAPPAPVYGLIATGDGTLELGAIGFTTFDNTYGITAGLLDLYWWNELSSPSPFTLASAIDDTMTTITLSDAGDPQIPLVQIGGEILEIVDVLSGGTEYEVVRGAQDSTAASHAAGTSIYHLQRTTIVLPFVKGFFGSPASGSFRQSIHLPDARVGLANLAMLNAFGNGAIGFAPFGATIDNGLRTLSGGQISIQVEGYLAIQDSAAPALVIEQAHSVRDIFAVVREPSDGGDIELALRQDDDVYCTLTIPEGETISNVVSGFGLAPLAADARLYLDVTNVPGAPNTLPGRDLTVTLRM
jgi:hypothetical protein